MRGRLEWFDNLRSQNLTTHHHSTRTLRGFGTSLRVGNPRDPYLARNTDAPCNLSLVRRIQDAADEVLQTDQ